MKKNSNRYTIEDFRMDFQKYMTPDWATMTTARRNADSVSAVFVADQYLAYVKGDRGPYLHDFTLVKLSEVVREGKTLLTL